MPPKPALGVKACGLASSDNSRTCYPALVPGFKKENQRPSSTGGVKKSVMLKFLTRPSGGTDFAEGLHAETVAVNNTVQSIEETLEAGGAGSRAGAARHVEVRKKYNWHAGDPWGSPPPLEEDARLRVRTWGPPRSLLAVCTTGEKIGISGAEKENLARRTPQG
ncbi:hypothetical protein NDU88_006654 [Pleurodeles waltl]|uniref:Uncharacterized protein n=1 Tax=Pleurodeles waltl TaxID=8319 RepID=A0AAV7TXP3_PLEWA|nr:hypothetical protein NDU88_006654 [Pleurodeles waltl]